MNMPCNILLMELKQFQPRFTGLVTELNFNQVVMEGCPEPDFRGNLLLAHRSYLTKLSGVEAAALICIDDTDEGLPVSLSTPVIFVQEDIGLPELFDAVSHSIALSHANDGLKSQLLSMLSQDATLDQLLRAATKQLGNPFTFFTPAYRLIGHSLIENLATDTAKEAIHTGHINEGLLQQLQKNGDLGKIQRSGKVEHTKLPNGPEKLSLALHSKGTYMGVLSIYNYVRPFEPTDYDIMEFLGKLIHIHLLKGNGYVPFESDGYRAFLTDLLEYPCAPDIVNAKCRSLGISFGRHLMVMLISPSERDIISKNFSLPILERHWSGILPGSNSFIYQDRLVCVFEPGSSGTLDPPLRTRVQAFLEENNLYAGVSNLFFDVTHFKIHYEQGLYALHHAKEQIRLTFFYDYILEYALEICTRNVSLKHLLHPTVSILAEHDTQYGTNYLYTLEVLLDCDGKLANCAKTLGVHYNTVKYRLKNIQQIVGEDFNDLHTMAQLILAFKVRHSIQK